MIDKFGRVLEVNLFCVVEKKIVETHQGLVTVNLLTHCSAKKYNMSVTVCSRVDYQILLLQKLTGSVCQICHLKEKQEENTV